MASAGPRPERLLLATGNRHKLIEVREILAPLGIAVLAPADIGYDPDVDETADSFDGNAILKAEAGLAATGLPCVADDSGIEARALGWRPGVHSARYAGRHGDDEANNRKLVAELAGATDRFVRYRCAIALAMPGAPVRTWSGIFPGEHIPEPRGVGGFGYDPHVLVPDLGRTVAELSAEEKHARSHRGEALRAMAAWLASA